MRYRSRSRSPIIKYTRQINIIKYSIVFLILFEKFDHVMMPVKCYFSVRPVLYLTRWQFVKLTQS